MSKSVSKRQLYTSNDGSTTIYWPKYDEHYHSIHGAVTESNHVFIKAGLAEAVKLKNRVSIFEMGFGTGLNALLTLLYATENQIIIDYTTIEAFPIEETLYCHLDFEKQTSAPASLLHQFHSAPWNKATKISNEFTFYKKCTTLEEFSTAKKFDLIYYDAFAPSAQPELWEADIFKKLYHMLNKNGLLTTYCAKGQVKRDLKAVGFDVETLPGPPGKREMTRAKK